MTQVKQHKDPLLRIAKRDAIGRPKAYAIRLIGVLLSLLVSGAFIFAVTKLNPIQVYNAIFDGAFGTERPLLGHHPGCHDAPVHRRGPSSRL